MRRIYLVIFVALMALAASGVYLRQRAKAAEALRQAAANCDTPAAPVPIRAEGPVPAAPPPNLPGFKIEPACGTGAEAPKAAEKKK
jgi:hypothetical protein